MSKPFPNNPLLRENYAPVMAESDAPELVVAEGELPEGLAGTLYRNGPNPMFPPLGNQHHWFLGEGMVHAIHVEGGKASYRNRWVRTEGYKAQRKAGCRLIDTAFGGARAPGGRRPSGNGRQYEHRLAWRQADGDRRRLIAGRDGPCDA